jgi:hypothetical protein
MSRLENLLDKLRKEWAVPRAATHRGNPCPFLLRCTFEEPADEDELRALSFTPPRSITDFWRYARSARLFEDVAFGQWGLEVFSPNVAFGKSETLNRERQKDVRPGDLIIGGFLGDTDLLVVRCDPSVPDFGAMLVCLPLDDRSDWYEVAHGFEEFLTSYAASHGDKHWEA